MSGDVVLGEREQAQEPLTGLGPTLTGREGLANLLDFFETTQGCAVVVPIVVGETNVDDDLRQALLVGELAGNRSIKPCWIALLSRGSPGLDRWT